MAAVVTTPAPATRSKVKAPGREIAPTHAMANPQTVSQKRQNSFEYRVSNNLTFITQCSSPLAS